MQMLSIQLPFAELSTIETLRYIHFVMCLLGALVIFFIWGKSNALLFEQKNSLLYIVMALLLWCGMDLYRILGFMKPGHVSIVIKIFSTYNNALFLCALPFFENKLFQVKTIYTMCKKPDNWAIAILSANIFVVLAYALFWNDTIQYNALVKNFDVLYSVISVLSVSWAISGSFARIETSASKQYYYTSWILIFIITVPQFMFLSVFSIAHFESVSILLLLSQLMFILLLIVLIYEAQVKFERDNIMTLKKELDSAKMVNDAQINGYQIVTQKMTEQIKHLQTEIEQLKGDSKKMQRENANEHILHKLSEREKEVLKLIDKSYTEIGLTLYISRETAITHKKNIESKLNLHSKEELIQFARENNFIQ